MTRTASICPSRPLLTVTYTAPTVGCTGDAQCTNGVFCDGVERCVGGACVPGTAVGIVWKEPRISDGASGLGSKVSRWLGPPDMNRKITFLALASIGGVRGASGSAGG